MTPPSTKEERAMNAEELNKLAALAQQGGE